MLRKIFMLSVFLLGLTAMSLASVGGDSKYVKLYVYDAATNGPVTARTTHINAFVSFIDLNDLIKTNNYTANNSLLISYPTSVANSYINDLENNPGTIRLYKAGQIGPKGYQIGSMEGNMSVYLGEYTITPSQSAYFKGGAVIQFNFVVVSGSGDTALTTQLYATEVVPFNIQ